MKLRARMRRIRLIVPALLAVVLVVPGAATSSIARGQSAGTPDTYVTDWDAVGVQAFTAAALTPAEGHVIFAYVAIAVYDSVMAVEGGYGRSRSMSTHPRGPRPRRRSQRPPIASSATTSRPRRRRSSTRRTPRRWSRSPTARRRPTASRPASRSRPCSSPRAPTTDSERP